jgi:general secretion pathway protein K
MIKKVKNDLGLILNNQRGVALMMIMTSIILLMAIYGEFTFESKISRIKATNIMDRSQAKLLAESGLQLAMARLKLYKEAFNKLEQNSSAKQQVPPQLLNQLWEVPFIYPVPIAKNAAVAVKSTVEKFQKETLLEGEMKVSIQNVSSRINLNMLRVDELKNIQKRNSNDETFNDDEAQELARSNDPTTEAVDLFSMLLLTMRRAIDAKINKDDDARDRFANIEIPDLIRDLMYFTSDVSPYSTSAQFAEAATYYQKGEMSPKHGPLASISELYTLHTWNDELVEMIQNEYSVHPTAQIDLNKMTSNMLRILVPVITDDQVKSFFEYRDDPDSPKFFKTTDDFKRWVVDVERIMTEANFNERIESLKLRGITFGSNPNLFKVISEGTYNRSTFTLVAYVQIPKQETAPTPAPAPNPNSSPGNNPNNPPPNNPSEINTPKTTEHPTQLMEPRIIEIQIN